MPGFGSAFHQLTAIARRGLFSPRARRRALAVTVPFADPAAGRHAGQARQAYPEHGSAGHGPLDQGSARQAPVEPGPVEQGPVGQGAQVSVLAAELGRAQQEAAELQALVQEQQRLIQELRQQVNDLEDRKEAELGRLESGAITALESTISAHREQVAALEDKLRAAQAEAAENAKELVVERSRNAQLQTVLAGREQRIATLVTE